MVIHLWGKFFMAAWRGRRALTWVTGAVAFLGSIGTAFTGYLSQTNFDSQWIADPGQGRPQRGRHRRRSSTSSNPGQMLLWHVVLLPLVLGVLIVAARVLVRRHGVVPPFDAVPPSTAASRQLTADAAPTTRPSPSRPVVTATDRGRHAGHDARLAPVPDPARTTWSRSS